MFLSCYNTGGQVNRVSDLVSGTVDYTYNAMGSITAITTTFEHVQSYDAANRALQELDRTYQQAGTETITTTRGVDPDGNVVTQTVQEMQPAPQTHTDTLDSLPNNVSTPQSLG